MKKSIRKALRKIGRLIFNYLMIDASTEEVVEVRRNLVQKLYFLDTRIKYDNSVKEVTINDKQSD